MNRRVEVAVEGTTGKCRPAGISRPIELELIDPIFAHHTEAGVAKALVVLGPRQREATFVGLEALLLPKLQALLLRIAVTAPRRHPDPGRRAIQRGGLPQTQEAVREAGVKSPQCPRLVPAIVEQEGVEHDPTLPNELFTEGLNDAERLLLGVLREIPDVVPGVVMQKCAVRMRALALDVGEKVTPHLPWPRGTDHARYGERRLGSQRQFPRECTPYLLTLHGALRQRMLEANEPAADRDWTAFHVAAECSSSRAKIQEHDLAHRERRADRAERHLLPQIARPVAELSPPRYPHSLVRILEQDCYAPGR